VPNGGTTERYRLYIDESGDHVFHNESTLQQPTHRYLALVGCWFRDTEYVSFHKALEELKQKHFPHNPDEPVILHREDLINCRGPFWRLRNAPSRIAFDTALLHLIDESRFIFVIAVIDKLKLKHGFPHPFHPYHLALDFILQRYCFTLNHDNRKGDVMAESRGGREDKLLKNAYIHIHTHGDMHHRASFYQQALTSKELKLKPKSANISGLQLADLIANTTKQKSLIDWGLIPTPPTWSGSFGEKMTEVLAAKYNRNVWTSEMEGYGRVLYPK
jgi:hypothetical protein